METMPGMTTLYSSGFRLWPLIMPNQKDKEMQDEMEAGLTCGFTGIRVSQNGG